MSDRPDRRSRRRLQTRQAISDAAAKLFLEHGFDAVTVADIARAADVGRMTVFNHFPCKEDMVFDRDAEAHEIVVDALRRRDPGLTPIETLRRAAHRAVVEQRPFVRFFAGSKSFLTTVENSETLKSRARAIRDEVADSVAASLAACAGREPADPDAELAAALLLATWSTALVQAHRVYRRSGDEKGAQGTFIAIVDKGSLGLEAALADTPYAARP